MHRKFGISVIAVTTIVGTAVFATLRSSKFIFVQIIIGLLSVTAAVLASLQTFLNYGELSERHKFAAFKYGVLRREVEQLLTMTTKNENELLSFVETFRTKWDAVDNESPIVPQRFVDNAREQVRKSMESARKRKS